MVTIKNETRLARNAMPTSGRSDFLGKLVGIASSAANIQLNEFATRLSDAMLAFSEQSVDSREANISFNAGNLLKKNIYAFYYLASARLEANLREAVQVLEYVAPPVRGKVESTLSLVPYAEMENKVLLGNLARPLEAAHADRLAALGIRTGSLLERDAISVVKNPFRPEVFLSAMNDAWCEFDPDHDSHPLILQFFRPDVFLDLSPILQSLNDALIAQGILPELTDSYRIRKTNADQESTKNQQSGAVLQQLRSLFSGIDPALDSGDEHRQTGMLPVDFGDQVLQATVVSKQLLGYLANAQKIMLDRHVSGAANGDARDFGVLTSLKNMTPQGTMTRVDENTIDLLAKIFEVIFSDSHIPTEIKALIGFLQVPVLKAALLDKEFFFNEEHPARRMIDVMTKSSVAWDQKKGQDDPLFQAMKRNVERVQHEFDQQVSVFSDVVSELESFIHDEEQASTSALSEPIDKALRQEKLGQATKTARNEVALRIGTGEVVAFVETFLESKWVPVLTIAYTLGEEQPQAVKSAIQTMEDLIWSVKPKITQEQRKELIGKLPSMLAMLNKWLNVVKWEDADRLQFFAELAECHASIVRAPIAMTPERQLEIAMDIAKKAAERRLEKQAKQQPEPVPDDFDGKTTLLASGSWLEFTQKDGSINKVKLAWVSPMRSLYIFTTGDKKESFSVSDAELAQAFRENRAQVVLAGRVVDRALTHALESMGANDASNEVKSAA